MLSITMIMSAKYDNVDNNDLSGLNDIPAQQPGPRSKFHSTPLLQGKLFFPKMYKMYKKRGTPPPR